MVLLRSWRLLEGRPGVREGVEIRDSVAAVVVDDAADC